MFFRRRNIIQEYGLWTLKRLDFSSYYVSARSNMEENTCPEIGAPEAADAPRNNRQLSIGRMAASSLVEVLVSLSLASIVFVIGGMVWLQINGSNAPHREIEQRMVARQLIADAIQSGGKQDQVFTIGGTKYLRKINLLNPETHLGEITITVFGPDGDLQFSRGQIAKVYAK